MGHHCRDAVRAATYVVLWSLDAATHRHHTRRLVLLTFSYDVMNDLMSGTLHRYWKDEFVRMMGPLVSRGGSGSYGIEFSVRSDAVASTHGNEPPYNDAFLGVTTVYAGRRMGAVS